MTDIHKGGSMSAARRNRRDRFSRPGRPDRDRGQPAPPQLPEDLLRAAARAAINDVLKAESADKTLGRLRAMGLNSKIAAAIYAKAREQVKKARRRMVAITVLLGLVCLLAGLAMMVRANWPGTGEPWQVSWPGLIVLAVGAALAVLGYRRWQRLVRIR